ncbi:MAG: histidine kinase, partial [Bacteroidota bacterium]
VLKSRNLVGEEVHLTTPIHLQIAPPWWRTRQFYAVTLLLFGGIIYGIFRYSVNRVKRKNAAQFQIEKKFAELEMQALQAQMNPHFIFNCLNGIQNFILNQETHQAVGYMGKFGQLMRLFLEASKNKFIALDEEIKLLRLYTELEQMRFSNVFEVDFKIPSDLDIEAIQIPSLLIQPFVENAILHGLTKLPKGGGQLIIQFFENESGRLICQVKDNGIGREQAAKLKAQSVQQHVSRATQIVNERLEVLRQMNNLSVNIEMHDAYPERKYTGTLVRIFIAV